jgi:hypothetical protein
VSSSDTVTDDTFSDNVADDTLSNPRANDAILDTSTDCAG